MTPALKRLQRRLERAELELLRRHVVELAAKLEDTERRLENAERDAHNAEIVAGMWCDVANQPRDESQQPPRFGITKCGDIMRVNA